MSQTHIIQRQVLNLHLARQDGAFEIQNRLSNMYHADMTAVLQQLCERVVDVDEFLQIDKLEIDLGVIRLDQLEIEFLDRFRVEFEEALSIRLLQLTHAQRDYPSTPLGAAAGGEQAGRDPFSGTEDRVMSGRDMDLELVRFFLRTGRWPWWSGRPAADALEPVLAGLLDTAPAELVEMIHGELRSSSARQRAIYQFTDTILIRLMASAISETEETVRGWVHILKQGIQEAPGVHIPPAAIRRLTWEAIFSAAATVDRMNFMFLEVVLDRILVKYPVVELSILIGLQTATQQPGQTSARDHIAGFQRLVDARMRLVQGLASGPDSPARSPGTFRDIPGDDVGDAAGARREYGRGTDVPRDAKRSDGGVIGDDAPSPVVNGKTATDVVIEKPLSTDETSREMDELQRIAVQNAGLVILWPFFKGLFESLDILDDGGGLQTESTPRAIHLLQYLVTGESGTPEFMLPLNKLLCGWSLGEPVDRTIEFSARETDQADQLLQAVIEHWSALKRTSVDGLRASFLQRDGLLSGAENHWLLQVELMGHDILLDCLPWGISMIKLSWMKKMLKVDWARPG